MSDSGDKLSKRIKELNGLLMDRKDLSGESLKECDEYLFETFRACCIHLTSQALRGQGKGTSAYTAVIDKLYWILADAAKRRGIVFAQQDNDVLSSSYTIVFGDEKEGEASA